MKLKLCGSCFFNTAAFLYSNEFSFVSHLTKIFLKCKLVCGTKNGPRRQNTNKLQRNFPQSLLDLQLLKKGGGGF